jgi:peptide/nickel transport system permease protein
LFVFWAGVSIDWLIPRLVPGDPIAGLVGRYNAQNQGQWTALYKMFEDAFGYHLPLWDQYWHYWDNLFHGNLGISILDYPDKVSTLIASAVPYTVALLVPAISLSYFLGNRVGALAARRKLLDNTVLPIGYIFQAMPYAWFAMAAVFYLGVELRWFPVQGGYSLGLVPGWDWSYIWSLIEHWFLPFLTVFLVSFGGWAIGMRNLVIYELETDYARYLRSLGAPQRLVRKYAYRNAVLPQLSGLALQLGIVIGGNIVTEVVFDYPGLGHLIFTAIQDQDYALTQGIFIFIVMGVLIANFVIDIVYVIVDPRTRLGMQGAQA